ncbi:MAG: LL-diaminopimelate aminotransferase [Phycisphaerales bacterium]
MVFINEHYLKLQGEYLFPEIGRRVEAFGQANPKLAERLIPCGIGDVTEPLPPAVIEAMHHAVDELADRATFRGYGPGTGYEFLRSTIAEHDFRGCGIDITDDEVFVSDGSKCDCGAILDILGRGNRIAITDPVYPVYVDTNVMAGNTGTACGDGAYAGILYLPCTAENGFVPAVPNEKVDLIYLCYPNNPTGAMINHDQLRGWIDYALANDAIILYDAAYAAYISDESLPKTIYEIDGARRCAIEFHSFSKNGGFTGVRCGYTVCPKDLHGVTRDGTSIALHGLWSRRWNTKSNGVCYAVQRGAEALYSHQGKQQVAALIEHYLGNAARLREGCQAAGLTVYGGTHSPYVWVASPSAMDSWGVFDRLLNEAHVVTTPGVGFGGCGEGYFRISAFNTRENTDAAVERLRNLSW